MNSISFFGRMMGAYLPNDIDDWYEAMSQYVYDYEMAMDNIGGDWEG